MNAGTKAADPRPVTKAADPPVARSDDGDIVASASDEPHVTHDDVVDMSTAEATPTI